MSGLSESSCKGAKTPDSLMDMTDEEGKLDVPAQEAERKALENKDEERRDGSEPQRADIRTVRLNGARKKKFKWLMQRGMTREEALVKCQEPLDKEGTERPKRLRQKGDTPEAKRTKLNTSSLSERRDREQGASNVPTRPSYREAMQGIKIGIVPKKFPEEHFNKERFMALEKAIQDQILETEGFNPQFHGTTWKDGWLQVNCATEETATWLRGLGPKLGSGEGAEVQVVKEEDFPRRKVIIVNLPKTDMDEGQILGYLRRQNGPELKIDRWRVYRRAEWEKSTQLTVGVDQDVARRILETGKLWYMMGKANVWERGRRENPEKKGAAEEERKEEKEKDGPGPSGGEAEREVKASTSASAPVDNPAGKPTEQRGTLEVAPDPAPTPTPAQDRLEGWRGVGSKRKSRAQEGKARRKAGKEEKRQAGRAPEGSGEPFPPLSPPRHGKN